MTHKLNQSFIDFAEVRGVIIDFKAAVTRFCAEINSWQTREQEVDAQPPLLPKPQWHEFDKEEDPGQAYSVAMSNWSQHAIEHKARFPRPSAHPDVEASVTYSKDAGKWVEDYEIVDDGPTPEQILDGKKADLHAKVLDAELKAKNAVTLTPGKQRLANMIRLSIDTSDQAVMRDAVDGVPMEDVAKIPFEFLIELSRTEEQKKFLAEEADREGKLANIEKTAAVAMAAIDDLTPDNIDTFVLPVFET